MLEVVTFRWKPPAGYRSTFGPEHVNALKRMVAKHYQRPHRFNCVTDDGRGLDSDIRVIPLWNDYAEIPNPHGQREPSCYRRLKLFAPEMREIIGPRFVALDLDMVVTGDLGPLFDRPEEIVLLPTPHPSIPYNGSALMMTAGCRSFVWESFDPNTSPALAKANRCFGSDQGWFSFCLKDRNEATWATGPGGDGVYFNGRHLKPNGGALPDDARLVSFHGKPDPWQPEALKLPWVREHYGVHLDAQAAAA